MNFDDIVEADLEHTLEADGVSITLTPPGGTAKTATGIYNTHSMTIDASTGEQVVTSIPSVSLRKSTIQSFIDSGDWPTFPIKGWAVSVAWRGGTVTGKISQIPPDDRLGIIAYLFTR